MASNKAEYYKEVSLRLNRILDSVGLAEDIRWKRINMWIQSDEVISLHYNCTAHFFGSQPEATTTPGLNSDIDHVICLNTIAVQNIQNWAPRRINVLVVSDESTPPGYVKLQGICCDQPLPVTNVSNGMYLLDRFGRSVLSHNYSFLSYEADAYHGPAATRYLPGLVQDKVLAVKLYVWPDQASNWLTRKRRYNWPSRETIGLIQEMGALLVPVGHKLSQEQHLEWRVSFSYGEKLLMWLFNSIQYKCYILLKMINKCFIKPVVGDDVLSSYHLKTCMFYLIENTPEAIWQQDNLLLLIDMCLRLLCIWIECKYCPNYFIPEENMFQCKIYGDIPGQLHNILRNLLRHEGRYLVYITCDNVGEKLVMACQTHLTELELQSENVANVFIISVMHLIVLMIQFAELYVRKYLYFESQIIRRIFVFQNPRREVSTIFWKFLCSYNGSKLASESLSEEIPDQRALDMAQELLLWGSSSDVASGKLKLAAFYIAQSNLQITEDVLNEIHKNYSYRIFDKNKKTHKYILESILSENLSTTQLISRYVAFPVHYHPSEISCIPKALIPEMFRFIGSDEVDSGENYVPDIVSIDPKLYLYFLEFLCYHWQNNILHKKVALGNMIYFIRHEEPSFEDTALNLLAYCLMQEGNFVKAYNILCKSMKLECQHNAAKLQISAIIKIALNVIHGGQ
ncbi:hypothetical protein ACJMK2_011836 [Sinanodonta woodiana]|uniref:Mab-21-like HhH/H2TH-like domain-containing protein n=1 Tax=Sinanodonta woodiana TaxID=1069815 RepID=A0ABD3V7G9_SINWO